MSSKKKIMLSVLLLAVLIAVMSIVYVNFMPKGNRSSKTITVEVVYEDKTLDTFAIKTKEEFLRGAMEQEKLIQGEEGDYGLYITAVNGVSADYDANQSWWCVTKNGGEMVTTGVDTTPIVDGEKYEFTY
ncbi:MAG: DUF4430 domain-containing protein, partial [Lachnospiraceae bacterium]